MTALAPAPTVAERWPGLYDVPVGPRAGVAAAIVRRLFGVATTRLGITVVVPNGHPVTTTGEAPTIVLDRPDEFYRRIGSDGLIGFGEGYQTGAWSSPDLGRLLTVLASEIATLVPDWMQAMRRLYVARAPRLHRNTVAQTRGNIAHHYDLSNDLFRTFLDPTMSYSSALFDTRVEPRGGYRVAATPIGVTGADLEAAQVRKVERMLDAAGVGEGSRLLEIGTGWGELAIRAAARGATVTSVTLSREQKALADERTAAAGFTDRVEVLLRDYRQVTGTFDAIVSVEMIEAVGHEYWRTYLEKVDSLLVPGGRAALQAITMPHDRMLATKQTYTWINKYIFPGGFLPSVEAIEHLTRDHTALRVTDRLSFGHHYAETLRLWDEAFRARHETVAGLGFDEVFERTWHFYLEYSRGGFASSYIDVNQIALTKEASA
ncbi:class I SAM-dependent methyltransferase [Nocardioides guangzhouensis]|uniref:Class I SAM-dependent methyltransferase n=1 Tax=Nocardioides guangzhouensis TaxID=2497878 RepID=A0A4Q4ZIB7_9ACTN|nr:cyclopropane-fatty-acyl-phospholipid synthase family protein [Nocardioides guangzhouensis]RYP87186.1 class I SAM-dependent methyltransferase [Nocardioides guangzhouensis]